MKTILVVYTNNKVESQVAIGRMKKYSFNTESEVSVGDLIESTEYKDKMQVVKVLDKSFTYYNSANGNLSNEFTSSSQWEIRTLELRESKSEIVYGKILKSGD